MNIKDNFRIIELDSIRGFAAFFVIFFHISKWSPFLDINFFNNCYLMVDLFFVISGFVIFKKYSYKICTKKDCLTFLFLRLGRLYPVHFFMLLIFLAIEFSKYSLVKSGFYLNHIAFQDNNIVSFFNHIFMIQAILPNPNLNYNSPAWSIEVEFFAYILFCGTILFFKEIKSLIFIFFLCCSFYMLLSLSHMEFVTVLRCFSGFFMGCLIANSINNIKLNLPNSSPLICLITIFIYLQFKTPHINDFRTYDVLMYFFSAALIVSIVFSSSGMVKKFLNLSLFVWLGSISYSIYMTHYFVLILIRQLVSYIMFKTEAEQILFGFSIYETLFFLIILVGFILFVASCVYYIIEEPFREKSRSFVLKS